MLGELLKAWRWKNEMGIREAAECFGVSSSTLNRIEMGEEMSALTMLKFINVLFKNTPARED